MFIETEILVIGSGIAGLSYAIKASEYADVLIITKKEKAESNTNYAQGGIAAVISKDDSVGLHIADTIKCGDGLCHRNAVKFIVENGLHLIKELISYGVKFSIKDGELDLGKEGGHSAQRIVHSKDLTGKEIEKSLLKQISKNPRIKILEHHSALELITEHHLKTKPLHHKNKSNIHCYGAYIFDEKKNVIKAISSKLTVICTGGIGQVYLHTTNPSIATGDGIAMAYRSGAATGNMEFVQFHPTSFYLADRDTQTHAFLISEAMRGAGAELRTKDGKAFMYKYDKRGSLAPRDIVARAIDNEMKKRGDDFVYLDTTKITASEIKKKFPNIYEYCLKSGIDITKEYIPVVPAAHYMCGGIVTDLNGRTSINNLYALGEAAMSGVHGANRLASNSLLEALVIAESAAQDCKKYFLHKKSLSKNIPEWNDKGTVNAAEWILISQNRTELKEIMSNYVGIVRSNQRLNRALKRVNLIRNEIEKFYKKTKITRELIELRNMALISYLIIISAISRKESRGLHYNTDYPFKKKRYTKDTILINKKF